MSPLKPIRVLVIDDAVVVRRMVSDALSSDPDIEVIATASTGKIGLKKIEQLKPDIATLDIEMPEMDGLETLRELRRENRKLPVIMFSTLTERGASATLDALSLGANDYVTKPANVGSVTEGRERIRTELIPKIKALCGRMRPMPKSFAPKHVVGREYTTALPARPGPVDILAIGVSTGGPNALAEFMPVFREDFPLPILIVQHMPPVFTRLLADRLDTNCGLKVVEAADGEPIVPGKAWIAPGDHHMVVEVVERRRIIRLTKAPPENSCRPAVDPMFRSVARIYGSKVIGAVLTGMGKDGLLGCKSLREAGARIIAQDEATSVVWGMPGHVAQAGHAERVLPLDQIAPQIVRWVEAASALRRPLSFQMSQGMEN